VGARLEGMDQLLRRVSELGQSVDNRTEEKALNAGGELLKEKVKESAPVRTGHLKDNIIVSDVKNGEINVGPDQQGNAFYGHMLEFGTSKMSAKPFMGPVYENNKQEVQDAMSDVIKRELGL
jgi:HK97 gp10 family phage protein